MPSSNTPPPEDIRCATRTGRCTPRWRAAWNSTHRTPGVSRYFVALNPLIASEIKAAAGKDRHDSAITPANYRLELIGEEAVGPYRCYVLRAIPKRVDKYLFVGKVWVDEDDFAVVRIEGRPAASLSFWIKRAEFVRQYQKIGGFWPRRKMRRPLRSGSMEREF